MPSGTSAAPLPPTPNTIIRPIFGPLFRPLFRPALAALRRFLAALSARHARRIERRRRLLINAHLRRDIALTDTDVRDLFTTPVLARDDW
ncbi:MAG: hypothetical protein AAF968_04810 [Pseudomonadota bacterium]